jgi:hypothetical protein
VREDFVGRRVFVLGAASAAGVPENRSFDRSTAAAAVCGTISRGRAMAARGVEGP